MKNLFFIFGALEMLCINMYTFHICSKKRYSNVILISVISLYTILFFGIFIFLLKDSPGYGNGAFVLLGMTYLILLVLLYKQSITYSISLMCSSWIYTMLIFSLSMQISRLFPEMYSDIALLTSQTLLYVCTLYHFKCFVQNKFLYIIKHADKNGNNALLRLGLFWFLFAVLLNFVLVFDTNQIIKILVVCIMAANALMTYQMFYSFSRANQSTLELERASRLDALTGLKNRKAFFEDIQERIDNRTSFTIIFMDLDNFKSINDEYGHLTGDQYLKHFSDRFSAHFSYAGTIYRISGDEFVFLYENRPHAHLIYEKIEKFDAGICCGNVPFKGLSIGRADYPSDAATLHDLISVADERMYQAKGISENK